MEMLIRRGYFWQSFEIYGGIAGFIDYGPLGNGLRRNLEQLWRKFFVINERAIEIDTPTIGIEEVFIASGHVASFVDLAIECKSCSRVFRADHYIEEKLGIKVENDPKIIKEVIDSYNLKCECGGEFKDPKPFNLMLITTIGPGKGKRGYLRPETAQGIFISFKRLASYFRDKLPFAVAQIGRAYRNEISPRQGVIRLREFNQAELEVFVNPEEKNKHPEFDKYANTVITLIDKNDVKYEITLKDAVDKGIIQHEYLAFYIGKTQEFLIEAGINKEKIRFRQHKDDERAHYAIDCWDAEVLTSFGWIEVVGIADRTDYDLKMHSKYSGEDLSIFIPYKEPKEIERLKIIPDIRKIGPKFKDKAKKIIEILENYEVKDENIEKVVVSLNGNKIEITREYFEVKRVKEKIHGKKVIPHVIEPSFGLDRITYAILEHAFDRDIVDGEERRVLRLKRWIAPVQAAVLPLLSKDPFISKAKEIVSLLKRNGIFTEYDDSGSIGRRYRRFDEIGTPFCITVDHQTFEDDTVTIRDRDTTKQIRIKIEKLPQALKELLTSEKDISEYGPIFKEGIKS